MRLIFDQAAQLALVDVTQVLLDHVNTRPHRITAFLAWTTRL